MRNFLWHGEGMPSYCIVSENDGQLSAVYNEQKIVLLYDKCNIFIGYTADGSKRVNTFRFLIRDAAHGESDAATRIYQTHSIKNNYREEMRYHKRLFGKTIAAGTSAYFCCFSSCFRAFIYDARKSGRYDGQSNGVSGRKRRNSPMRWAMTGR